MSKKQMPKKLMPKKLMIKKTIILMIAMGLFITKPASANITFIGYNPYT
jgi:hypothetical protein